MTELEVLNDCLASLGEAPVNSPEDDHPFLPTAKRMLSQELTKLQGQSWWFNQELIRLEPDSNQHIYVPGDAIRCDPQGDIYQPYVQRGRRLYDAYKGTYEIDHAVLCWLIRAVPLEDLPPSAQQVVALATVQKFQQAYDADRAKSEMIRADYQQAWVFLRIEHMRNIKGNFMNRTSYASSMNRIMNGGGAPFPSVSGNWR